MNYRIIFYILYLLLLPFLLLKACGLMFYQNDYITSKIIFSRNNELVFYDVFKTGLENYRCEFKEVYQQDTIKLFDYYINDNLYSSNTFKVDIQSDSIIVSAYNAEPIVKKCKFGTVVLLKNKK